MLSTCPSSTRWLCGPCERTSLALRSQGPDLEEPEFPPTSVSSSCRVYGTGTPLHVSRMLLPLRGLGKAWIETEGRPTSHPSPHPHPLLEFL